MTKTDLSDGAEVRSELERLNPTAAVVEASFGEVEPSLLFEGATGLRPGPPPSGHSHGEVSAHSVFPRRAARLGFPQGYRAAIR